jgi:hypothetical protein
MPKKTKTVRKAPSPENIYSIRVTLRCIEPRIWREFLVPDSYTLGDLHEVLYRVMGWGGYHMHSFHFGSGFKKTYYSVQEIVNDSPDTLHEDSVILRDLLNKKGKTFTYEYDFGDTWLHEVRLMKIVPFDKTVPLPTCTAGARACPPEDCGGFPGYDNVVRVLKKAETEDDRQLLEWLGPFDPEKFSIQEVNRRLGAQIRSA